MGRKTLRKADRLSYDKTGESDLPARKTADILSTHKKMFRKAIAEYKPEYLHDLGNAENGKETFDYVLSRMIEPEKK